jgi:hypothetical protein
MIFCFCDKLIDPPGPVFVVMLPMLCMEDLLGSEVSTYLNAKLRTPILVLFFSSAS